MSVNPSTSIPVTTQEMMKDIFAVDRTRRLLPINRAIGDCIAKHKLSLQQIETGLREKHCFTYLIARKRNDSHADGLRFELNGVAKTYFLFTSTLHADIAMGEVLEESASYEENYQKLADTGFITVDSSKPVEENFKSGTIEMDLLGLLVNLQLHQQKK